MKKAGIVVDNYKLEKFKRELTAKGYTDFTVSKFTKDTSTIMVHVEDDQVDNITRLCKRLEYHFKRSN